MRAPDQESGSRDWETRTITADEAGARFYLDKLKPFRLAALQQDPDAFGSNYAREAAFSDSEWLDRLHNPLARTFVAVRADDIIASTTVFGPMASTAEDMRFLQQQQQQQQQSTEVAEVYHIMGVYTRPDSRGRGLGKALLEAALEDLAARLKGSQEHEAVAASVVRADVFVANAAARALYSAAGFATTTTTEHEASSTITHTTWADQGRDGLSMWRRL